MPLPAVFTSSCCFDHKPGPTHPDRPERLRAVHRAILQEDPSALREAEPAPRPALLRVHPSRYLDRLATLAAGGGGMLDDDTFMSPASFGAAIAGAGAALEAVGHAHRGDGHAFAAIRPPGHHAGLETAMGFCLLANAVIAAREAQALGRDRILIVDWDVHHGNGTQALVECDPSVRFVSLHQWPLYPGTGAASEHGVVGNVINLPRPPGLPPEEYVADLLLGIRTALTGWVPDLILISAGYDSMRGDPLAGFTLEPEHYGGLVSEIRGLGPGVPIVGLMEGGYAPERLAAGVLATLRALI
ncbi:MAG TPA: histone deacetylase [Gemmatimonadales bacterium]|nr:histone deacetylase [Gemmatimonadales bacterium]